MNPCHDISHQSSGHAGPVASEERSVIWRKIEVSPGGEVKLELTVEPGAGEE